MLLKNEPFLVHYIFSGKMRRYFSWQNFIDPFLVLIGFFQALFILIQERPKTVFSKGGYVSLPVVLAAFCLRKRIILHESDSRMGLANRISSYLADTVCVSFPNLLSAKKMQLTGNPIREEIRHGSKAKGYKLTGFSSDHPVILVWGGSQGAREINGMIQKDFSRLTKSFQIIHITGASKSVHPDTDRYKTFEYLDQGLPHIYAITDIVVGRAGANSLYELAAVKKPNVLIPLPNADQQLNARYFASKGAGIIMEKEDSLYDLLYDLWSNPGQRELMAESLGAIARPKAAHRIAELILKA